MKLKLEKFKILSMRELHTTKGASDPTDTTDTTTTSDTYPTGPILTSTLSTKNCGGTTLPPTTGTP